MNYETSTEIEIALSKYFGIRNKLIVPNVSWGLNLHECDLLILSKSNYATEVEIKISKSDLKADKKKNHGHKSNKIKYLYFAVPEKIPIDFVIKHIPERAGIFVINTKGKCREMRKPKVNSEARAFTEEEKFKLARLGALRIWNLKETVIYHTKKYQYIVEELKKYEEG